MTSAADLHNEALAYHQRLPQRLWKYLNARGIPDDLIHKYVLGWNGRRITIPIPDREGKFAFFKLAKDPGDKSSSKMLSTRGAHAELYGWEHVLSKAEQIIICEGEFDRLVLEGQGFATVTSTAGAATFRPEWAEAFEEIPKVFICFDNDAAGRMGAERISPLIPHARLIKLPEEVGEGGDVTDFFVRLEKTREDFMGLLEAAEPAARKEPESTFERDTSAIVTTPDEEGKRLKSLVTIESIVGRYARLHHSGKNLVALCPFHDDRRPSFVVYPATQSFYCFGCQASGDVFTFLMKIEQMNFPEALRVLRELAA